MPHTMLQTAGDHDLGSESADVSRESYHPSNATFAECWQAHSGLIKEEFL
jgi:hypothetical protein